MPSSTSDRGFTLIELVTIMIVVGILAAVAIPKMDSTVFKERGFRDAVFSTLAHARRVAMASRRFVCVTIAGGTGSGATVSVTRDAGATPETAGSISCTQSVSLPAPASGCADNQLCAPGGVTLGGTSSVIFDPQGRLVSAPRTLAPADASITISNQPSITVVAETGYVQ